MSKKLVGIISILFIASCATTPSSQNSETQTDSTATVEEKTLDASVGPIRIANTSPYLDPSRIQSNIRQGCTALGQQLSEATRKFASKYDIRLTKHENLDTNGAGKALMIYITEASSSGNAFLGHRKSVSTKADFYNDGKLIDTYATTRNSGGGMWGGFKGSCSVLHRTVNTLGKDIAIWLKKNNY